MLVFSVPYQIKRTQDSILNIPDLELSNKRSYDNKAISSFIEYSINDKELVARDLIFLAKLKVVNCINKINLPVMYKNILIYENIFSH